MKFISSVEDLKDAVAKMSINETEKNKALKHAVENMNTKNKNTEADLFSQLSTAPNSPLTNGPDSDEVKNDQELSSEQVEPYLLKH